MKYNDSESYNDEVEATIASLQAQLEHPARVMQKQYRDLWTKAEEKLAEISDMHVKKCLAYRELEAQVDAVRELREYCRRSISIYSNATNVHFLADIEIRLTAILEKSHEYRNRNDCSIAPKGLDQLAVPPDER